MIKQVKTLFDDESAVSPVIGVILMVAITVILAAVIGTMVMDMTEGVGNTTPTAKFDVSDHNDAYDLNDTGSPQGAYQLAHKNGNDVAIENIRVLIKTADGTTIASLDSSSTTASASGNTVELQYNGASVIGNETISVGDSLTIVQTTADTDGSGVFTNGVGSDYQIQIVYTAGDSGSSLVDTTATLN